MTEECYVLFNVQASVVEGRPLFLYGIGVNGSHIYDDLHGALRYDYEEVEEIPDACALIPEWAAEEIMIRWGGHKTTDVRVQVGEWQVGVSDIGNQAILIVEHETQLPMEIQHWDNRGVLHLVLAEEEHE